MKPKVVIAANTAWYLSNFRRTLIRALSDAGFEVVAAAPPDAHVGKLAAAGCRFAPLPMDNGGTNPLRDLRLLFGFLRLLRAERPEVFLGYTVKPNVYGSMAARWLGIPVINNVAGLGAAFVREGWLSRLVALLYRLALSRSRKVFFQNREDLRLFVERGWVSAEATERSKPELRGKTLCSSLSPGCYGTRGWANTWRPPVSLSGATPKRASYFWDSPASRTRPPCPRRPWMDGSQKGWWNT
jgi:hypothetical protein